MADRPLVKPYPVVTNGNMSADIISLVTAISQISLFSYNMSWTGTPTGSLKVEVCNDAKFDSSGKYISGTGSWDALTFDVPVAAAGSADTGTYDIRGTGAAFVRLHYIRASGSGTLQATFAGKVF
jgi:hypothetical protein